MTGPANLWYTAAENDHRELATWPLRATPSVAVVLPVYERTSLLRRTLAGLAAEVAEARPFSVVVADDGSTEDVAAATASFRDRLSIQVVRREHEGYGAGQARNLGAHTADADVVIFLDADCIPGRGLVDAHLDWHRRADNVVVIGSRRHLAAAGLDESELAAGTVDLASRARPPQSEDGDPDAPDDFRRRFYRRTARLRLGDEAFRALVSSHFSVRRDRFLEVGGFSEDFARWGGEDTELGWRLFNAGLVFVPENEAVVYHQVDEDAGDDPGWRATARRRNEGMLQRKIPHRFYRTPRRGFVYEVPKVSWVVTPTAGNRIEELWDQLLRQSLTDFEMIVLVADPDDDVTRFLELTGGDPRVVAAPGADPTEAFSAAVTMARGEYLALLHGWAAVDHRLLGRAVRRLDRRPRAGVVRCGYVVRTGSGLRRYLTRDDVAALDGAWGSASPVFALTRTRDWEKLRRSGAPAERWWERLEAAARIEWLADALVALPAEEPPPHPPERVPAVTGDHTLLYEDLLRSGPRGAVSAGLRFLVSRARREPYRPADVEWDLPRPETGAAPGAVEIAYVGWVGKENMGDEAMLRAIRELLPGATIETDVAHPAAVMLGGGTLIGRELYLDWLHRKDSPRRERIVFGTGVADPEFWRRREPPRDWVDFLETCGLVGLRGPRSLEILRSWGYGGEATVVGDPALALTPRPDATQVPGRMVVSPAHTRGELWGSDDAPVFAALADVVRTARAEGRDVVFLSCFPGDDRHIFEVMRSAGDAELPYVAGYDDVDDALDLVASADIVVAERLHAAVLAAACGVPFAAIEYRPKVRDFAASLEVADLVVRADAVGNGALAALVASVAGEAETHAGRLRDAVATRRGHLRATAARATELLGG
jgi:polysaccharide pyruvyl transferase WcaK-like protein/GT2 family glycosyltransferase